MKKIISCLFIVFFSVQLFAQEQIIQIGQIAPEIALPTPNGKMMQLSSLKGKLVLIDFWASWCAPCVKEQPELKTIYEKHAQAVKENKFEILGVSLDKSEEDWVNAIQRLDIHWLQISDLKFWRSKVATDYAIEGLPYNVIVDEAGKIIAINLHGTALENFIAKHLQ
ncbi:MAG: TlpA family protein disulfide reductase [Chitinophagaceae bacterium]|nr:TlpA family protein disulfide reductase [Chitinophagaceae bacterium]MCW5906214.1 TlpA family protein disulfide reductase [Chitinophagaceae bacterium]